MLVSATLALGLCLAAATSETPLVTVPDPQAALKPETAEQRTARHAKVAKAREGTAIILHRAAWEYAPENTLSAVRAAFELGADGIETDFHRTLDGVIVVFHDDRLERLLDGLGRVEEYYYEELLLYNFNALPALAAETERVETLRDLLQILRSHSGLFMPDIKTSGYDGQILEELRNADMLDHVIGYNDYNSKAFQKAAIPTLSWKASLIGGSGNDSDMSEIESALKRPGHTLMLEDPRAALTALGKPPVKISRKPWTPLGTMPPPSLAALEAVLRGTSNQMPVRLAAVRLAIYAPSRFVEMAGELCRHTSVEIRRATAWNLGMIAKHRPALISDAVRTALLPLLSDSDTSVRGEAGIACARANVRAAAPLLVKLLADRPADYEQWTEDKNRLAERRTMIEARARWAFALGLMGVKSPAAIGALMDAMKHRAVHQDIMLVGFDGAIAASVLGKLHAAETVGVLREVLFHETPALAQFAKSGKKPAEMFQSLDLQTRVSIISDFRIRLSILTALAEIGSDDALAALEAVVDSPEKQLPWSQAYFRSQAAEALINSQVRDSASIVSRFLAHRVPEVRRSAIFACLKRSDPQYRKMLESAAPWAVPWWDVQHRP